MHLAQLNIALGKWNIDSPKMSDFKNNVDEINKLAELQDGFIWRYEPEDDVAPNAFGHLNILVNMSVWKSKKALYNYVYNTHHKSFLKRRKAWFHHIKNASMVFWYIKEGDIPTVPDAIQRLDYLRNFGESPYAFSFKSNYSSEDAKAYRLERD